MAYNFRDGGRTHVDLSGPEPEVLGEVPGKYVDLTDRDNFAIGAMPSPRAAGMSLLKYLASALGGAAALDFWQDPAKWGGWASNAASEAANWLPIYGEGDDYVPPEAPAAAPAAPYDPGKYVPAEGDITPLPGADLSGHTGRLIPGDGEVGAVDSLGRQAGEGPPPPVLPTGPISNTQIRSLIRRLGASANKQDTAYMNAMIDKYNDQGGHTITPDVVRTIGQRYRSDTPGWQPRRVPELKDVLRMRNPRVRQAFLRAMNDPRQRQRTFAPDIAGSPQVSPALTQAILGMAGLGQVR